MSIKNPGSRDNDRGEREPGGMKKKEKEIAGFNHP